MTKRARLAALAFAVGAVVAVGATGSAAFGGGEDGAGGRSVRVQLTGYQEDPQTISSPGTASFRATVSRDGTTISYQLSYAGLPTAVSQAHLHFGGRAQSGGVVVFLCTNLGNGPMGTPACPAAPATVTGTITAASVVGGAAAQDIAAGELAEVIAAARAGRIYVNIHTAAHPGGEIRGQIPGH
jgi:hypothetical protein